MSLHPLPLLLRRASQLSIGGLLVGLIALGTPQAKSDDPAPQPLWLDFAVKLADDGAGTSAWLAQDGKGRLWAISGSDADGYEYQFISSTGLDSSYWVTTTTYPGTWEQNDDGNYVFFTLQDPMPKPPPGPPIPGNPPPPPQQQITFDFPPLPDGTQIGMQYFPASGTLSITIVHPNGTSTQIIHRPQRHKHGVQGPE